jgi:hypothetical protein
MVSLQNSVGPSMPCGLDNPEMALRPFWGWPACRVGGLFSFWTPHTVRLYVSFVMVLVMTLEEREFREGRGVEVWGEVGGQVIRGLFGVGCLGFVVAGYGWLWLVVVGCGWSWLVLVGCGWLWLAVVGCGWLWLAVVGCGWLWLAEHCDFFFS